MQSCARCDATRAADDPRALEWVSEREPDGTARWICPRCARQHLRDIEAKLAARWWEPNA